MALASLACSAAEEPPNLVLIVGDDVGWSDFGFMGATAVRTPNLDRLAAAGTVFTHAMSSASTCKPALRTLLTGLDPSEVARRLQRAAREEGAALAFRDAFDTLPELLAERGYASFQAGKFWEGRYDMGGFTHGMTYRFGEDLDEFEGYHRHAGADALAIGRETMEPLWAFLEAHGDRPFFVWYAPLLPHLPHDAPEEFSRLYAGDGGPPWLRAYRANVTWFDATVGALLERLEAAGLRENTLVVYVSDNGWDDSAPSGSGGPRGKGSLRELGFRTPLVLAQPGVVAAGVRDGRLVMLADVFATLLDAAGAGPPSDSPGRSLLPLLLGGGDFYRDAIVGGAGPIDTGSWFLRTPTWRYTSERGRESLYRIDSDPFEERDLAARRPDVVARLRKDLRERLHAARTE